MWPLSQVRVTRLTEEEADEHLTNMLDASFAQSSSGLESEDDGC